MALQTHSLLQFHQRTYASVTIRTGLEALCFHTVRACSFMNTVFHS